MVGIGKSSVMQIANCGAILVINNRQILSKFVKNGNVSKMLCSEKFDRIFLYCQRGYILISIMTKFGRASLKDGQVITRCDENVTKL